MKRCSRCNGKLFLEHTEDGNEYVCLAGHRWSAVPLQVLELPDAYEVKQRNYGPSHGRVSLS